MTVQKIWGSHGLLGPPLATPMPGIYFITGSTILPKINWQ